MAQRNRSTDLAVVANRAALESHVSLVEALRAARTAEADLRTRQASRSRKPLRAVPHS